MIRVRSKPKTSSFLHLKILFLFFLILLLKIGAGAQLFIKLLLHLGAGILSFTQTLPQKAPRLTRFRLGLFAVIFLILVYSLLISKLFAQLPSPQRLSARERPLTTQIFDREGRVLYQIYEGQNRKLIRLDDLPKDLINATIAIEDKHFYAHLGIDPTGVIRAFRKNMASKTLNESLQNLQGGSTITQQLVKNTLLTPDQTLSRKIKEALLSLWIERIYSKKEILQMYFNEAPYGGPAWGIETASEMYFGKSAQDLNLAESSFLAGLPAAPTTYSPYGTNPSMGKERQKEVLRRMVEDGYISAQRADTALLIPLDFRSPTYGIKAPHFVMYVRALLASKYGERVVSQGGLKVITTLDLDLQEMAENIVSKEVNKLSALKVGNGAAMIVDTKTGYILSMVGSKDYFDPKEGNFNVTLSLRQPGSAIKPITYATAFKEGFSPGSVLLDVPTTFPNPWGRSYSPVNYDQRFHGAVTIRTALGSSYNVPAVKMLAILGLPKMLQTAKEMGITTLNKPEDYGLSLTLGGGGVRMLEMMGVYATLGNGGVHLTPQPILKVTDNFGNVLEDNTKPEGPRVLTEEVAYLINHILSDNQARTLAFGPNSLLVIPGHTVAVKTGTSDDKRDNWALGFTPEYVVGAWVGNNNNSPMDPKLTSGITGATPIWHQIMKNLLADKADSAFKRPKGVVESMVDGHKDLVIAGKTAKTVVGFQKVKQKNETTGQESEVISFVDPFSTYIPDQTKATQ